MRVDLLPPFGYVSGTKKHRVGLAPYEARQRDIVCILEGCSVPCVLRPRTSSDDTERTYDADAANDVVYDFIGEAYVYDFMDGDAIAMQEEEEMKKWKQSFVMV